MYIKSDYLVGLVIDEYDEKGYAVLRTFGETILVLPKEVEKINQIELGEIVIKYSDYYNPGNFMYNLTYFNDCVQIGGESSLDPSAGYNLTEEEKDRLFEENPENLHPNYFRQNRMAEEILSLLETISQ